ncbi:MAG: transposase [Rhodospirillaceae bacterium]|nr:transposase [Rhodospirillaceae bacterium]
MADMVRLAGIDVSKDKLDVYVTPSGESRTVGYDRRGVAGLRRWLVGLGVAVVAVEASGGYEREVSEVLEDAGLIVHRLNPLRVRRFAQLKGRLAKTDRLDARTIAEFARAHPQERQLRRDPRRERLAEHLLVRRHTQEAILDCINQLEHLRDGRLRRLVTARKASMERTLAKLDRCLVELIDCRARRSGRTERTPAQRARGRSGSGHHPDRPAPRTRIPDPPPGCLAGRRRSLRSQLRPADRRQEHPGRTRLRAQRPLHGRNGGLATQPCHRSLCRAPRRHAGQGPPRRLHAQAHRHSQRCCQGCLSMATPYHLKTKTVAPLGPTALGRDDGNRASGTLLAFCCHRGRAWPHPWCPPGAPRSPAPSTPVRKYYFARRRHFALDAPEQCCGVCLPTRSRRESADGHRATSSSALPAPSGTPAPSPGACGPRW